MLEHDALAGLHAIGAAIEDAADEDIGCVDAGIVHAGVAVVAKADFDIDGAGTADEDAEIGGEQNIGVAAGSVAGFDGAVIESHHQAGCFPGGNTGVRGQVHGCGRAHTQNAATGKDNGSDLGGGSYGTIGLDGGSAGGDEDGSADRIRGVEGNDGDGTAGPLRRLLSCAPATKRLLR